MNQLRIDPARLEAFALAYVPAVLAATRQIKPHMGALSAEEYAVTVALETVAIIKRAGIVAVEHYVLNGSALRATCEALGIEHSMRAMENYLEGK